MKGDNEAFETLMQEMLNRKFVISRVDSFVDVFTAYNKNYWERNTLIIVQVSREGNILVLLSGTSIRNLSQKQIDAVMCEYMEHFDLNDDGQLLHVMHLDANDAPDAREIDRVANITTRAYSLAATNG